MRHIMRSRPTVKSEIREHLDAEVPNPPAPAPPQAQAQAADSNSSGLKPSCLRCASYLAEALTSATTTPDGPVRSLLDAMGATATLVHNKEGGGNPAVESHVTVPIPAVPRVKGAKSSDQTIQHIDAAAGAQNVRIEEGLTYTPIFVIVHYAIKRGFVFLLAIRHEFGPLLARVIQIWYQRLTVVVLVLSRVLELPYLRCRCCVILWTAATHAADAVPVLFYLAGCVLPHVTCNIAQSVVGVSLEQQQQQQTRRAGRAEEQAEPTELVSSDPIHALRRLDSLNGRLQDVFCSHQKCEN